MLRQTEGARPDASGAYRQAASPDARLMAAAQEMMHGDPLDADQERAAQAVGWH